jgi:hypothetical protein
MKGLEPVSPLNVVLPPDLNDRVGRIASELGMSPSEVVRAAIRRGLAAAAARTETGTAADPVPPPGIADVPPTAAPGALSARSVPELKQALVRARAKRDMLTICCSCKKFRTETEGWLPADVFLAKHLSVFASHDLCPDCLHTLYGDYDDAPSVLPEPDGAGAGRTKPQPFPGKKGPAAPR